MLIDAVNRRAKWEFKYYCRLAVRLATSEFVNQLKHCARELFNLSHQLVSREHDRRDEAVEVLSIVVECFKEDDHISVRIQVAESLVNMIYLLASMNRYGEAIRCGDEAVALFGTATDPSIVEQVKRAKVNQANARYLAGAQSIGKG